MTSKVKDFSQQAQERQSTLVKKALSFFENLGIGVVCQAAAGKIISANSTAVRLLGLPLKDILAGNSPIRNGNSSAKRISFPA